MIKLYVPIKRDKRVLLKCTQILPDDAYSVPDTDRPRTRAIPNKKRASR